MVYTYIANLGVDG